MKLTQLQPRPTKSSESGFALLLVLFVVVLLALLVVNFAYRVQVDAAVVGNDADRLNAYWAAKSEIARGLSLLMVDVTDQPGIVSEGRFVVYDSLDDPWAAEVDETLFDDRVTALEIQDEYGKLNLNALITVDSETGETVAHPELSNALRALFRNRGLEADPVDAILDWLDPDDVPRPKGAENDYYSGLVTPFTCRNAPMDSIEELLLLPSIDSEAFFGSRDEEQLPLSDLLTVHGHPDGKVNVNTAPFEVLAALFEGEGRAVSPEAVALDVLEWRRDIGPFVTETDLEDFELLPPVEEPEEGEELTEEGEEVPENGEERVQPIMVDTMSKVFRIRADAQQGSHRLRIETVVWRDSAGQGTHSMFRTLAWNVDS